MSLSLDSVIGATGTIIGAAVAISVISDLQHQHYHRDHIPHKHLGRTKDGRLKVRKIRRGKKSKSGHWKTSRKTRKHYRRDSGSFL